MSLVLKFFVRTRPENVVINVHSRIANNIIQLENDLLVEDKWRCIQLRKMKLNHTW